jgi:hypothetical protein
VRFFLRLIPGLQNGRIRRREEVPVQIDQRLAFVTVAFDEIAVLEVNELQVKGGRLGMEKGPPFAADAETILHGLSTGDGDEREAIPSTVVVEIAEVTQIKVIQPVESNRVAGPYSQEHPFFGGSLRNREINVPCAASEREQGFRLRENNILWREVGKCGIATKEIRLHLTGIGEKEYFAGNPGGDKDLKAPLDEIDPMFQIPFVKNRLFHLRSSPPTRKG